MLKGSIVALITPFTPVGGVDFQALERLVKWHIESGTEALVLCGSTGEGSLLSFDEKVAVFRLAQKVGGDKIALIACTGTNNTQESVLLTREAKKLGMDAALVIVPYYVKPTERGVMAHFEEVDKEGLPLCVYHHPGRTGTKLSLGSLLQLCSLERVVAIKEVSGDLELAGELLARTDVPLFSGDDLSILAQLAMGFSGSITVIGNVIPTEWKELIEAGILGDFKRARELMKRCFPLSKAMTLETNPQCIKYAVSLLGKCLLKYRLPLVAPEEETMAAIRASLPIVESVSQ